MKFGTLLLALAIGSCSIVHADKTEMAQNITNYLSTTYPCSVNYVEVTEENVIITGTCPADGQFALVEITPADEVTENTEFRLRQPIDINQAFSITVDRKTTYDGIGYDRIFSRWAIVETTTGSDVLASHARYDNKERRRSWSWTSLYERPRRTWRKEYHMQYGHELAHCQVAHIFKQHRVYL